MSCDSDHSFGARISERFLFSPGICTVVVIIVGALIAAAAGAGMELTTNLWMAKGMGAVAAALAAVNIFGGFLVTSRMLAMYKKKER